MILTSSVVLGLFVTLCESQLHFLKFVNSGFSLTDSAPQYNSTLIRTDGANIGNRMSKASRICVDGMWALYNTTSFGEGLEDKTTVISVRGRSASVCTDEGSIPVLTQVQSIYYLGAYNQSTSGILVYSSPYLLGALWNITVNSANASDLSGSQLPSSITGFPLGSIAITGTSPWVICGDATCTNAVCIDPSKFSKLFLQRNTLADTTIVNGGWPKIVRSVRIVTADECAKFANPPTPKTARKIFKRSTSEDNAIEVYVQHM